MSHSNVENMQQYKGILQMHIMHTLNISHKQKQSYSHFCIHGYIYRCPNAYIDNDTQNAQQCNENGHFDVCITNHVCSKLNIFRCNATSKLIQCIAILHATGFQKRIVNICPYTYPGTFCLKYKTHVFLFRGHCLCFE